MKLLLALLLTCSLARAAVQDDIARTFLQTVVAQGVPVVVTNLAPVIKMGTSIIVVSNITAGAAVGGLVGFSTAQFTNHSASALLTNLAGVIVPGGTLNTDGSRLRAEWGGKMMNAAAGTNQLTITFGSITLLDSGLRPWSNSVFLARILIERTGPTSQHVEGYLRLGAPGNVGIQETNINIDINLDNSTTRRLEMNGASRRAFGITNNGFRVYYESLQP